MRIQLIQGWLTHTAGTQLDIGRGQADLLISRGVAVSLEESVQHKAITFPNRRKDRVSRETR